MRSQEDRRLTRVHDSGFVPWLLTSNAYVAAHAREFIPRLLSNADITADAIRDLAPRFALDAGVAAYSRELVPRLLANADITADAIRDFAPRFALDAGVAAHARELVPRLLANAHVASDSIAKPRASAVLQRPAGEPAADRCGAFGLTAVCGAVSTFNRLVATIGWAWDLLYSPLGWNLILNSLRAFGVCFAVDDDDCYFTGLWDSSSTRCVRRRSRRLRSPCSGAD